MCICDFTHLAVFNVYWIGTSGTSRQLHRIFTVIVGSILLEFSGKKYLPQIEAESLRSKAFLGGLLLASKSRVVVDNLPFYNPEQECFMRNILQRKPKRKRRSSGSGWLWSSLARGPAPGAAVRSSSLPEIERSSSGACLTRSLPVVFLLQLSFVKSLIFWM